MNTMMSCMYCLWICERPVIECLGLPSEVSLSDMVSHLQLLTIIR